MKTVFEMLQQLAHIQNQFRSQVGSLRFLTQNETIGLIYRDNLALPSTEAANERPFIKCLRYIA